MLETKCRPINIKTVTVTFQLSLLQDFLPYKEMLNCSNPTIIYQIAAPKSPAEPGHQNPAEKYTQVQSRLLVVSFRANSCVRSCALRYVRQCVNFSRQNCCCESEPTLAPCISLSLSARQDIYPC